MGSIIYTINFDTELYQRINPEYEAGNYSSAIKTAILFLTEEIRERTDLDIDGDTLVTKALSVNNPLIKINKLETETDKSEQIGYMLMLQGLYKAIRNPRNHNLSEDNRETCDDLLIMINYFLKLIKKSKTKFDFIEFCGILKDKYFDCSQKYSSEIIKIIPIDKLNEVSQKLIEKLDEMPYENVAWTLFSIKEIIKDEKLISFIGLIDSSLFKTDNINLIRASTIILRNDWEKLSKPTKIRIEKILMNAFRNMEIIYETDTDRYGNYTNYSYLDEDGITASYLRFISYKHTETIKFYNVKSIIEDKFAMGDEYIEFILSNFDKYIFRDHTYVNEAFDEVIISQLKSQDSKMYKLLSSGTVNDGNFDPYYEYSNNIRDAMNNL